MSNEIMNTKHVIATNKRGVIFTKLWRDSYVFAQYILWALIKKQES